MFEQSKVGTSPPRTSTSSYSPGVSMSGSPACIASHAVRAGRPVDRHHFDSGKSVFELNQGRHRDHLVCLQCGRVEEFFDPESAPDEIARERGQISELRCICTRVREGEVPYRKPGGH
jgi:hypothetical protein